MFTLCVVDGNIKVFRDGKELHQIISVKIYMDFEDRYVEIERYSGIPRFGQHTIIERFPINISENDTISFDDVLN